MGNSPPKNRDLSPVDQVTSNFPVRTTVAGQYTLKRKLGQGQYGVVYEAKKGDSPDAVAIKITRAVFADENEATLLRKLQHPFVLPVLDFFKEGDFLFVVTNLYRNRSLEDVVNFEQKSIDTLHIEVVKKVASQILYALRFLHLNNVIHRDLKPANLLVQHYNFDCHAIQIVVADFGLAKELGAAGVTKTICGSPYFMAPEVVARHSYSTNADIWALGVIIHMLLFGLHIDQRINGFEWIDGDRGAAAGPDLRNIVMNHCLLREPTERSSSETIFLEVPAVQVREILFIVEFLSVQFL